MRAASSSVLTTLPSMASGCGGRERCDQNHSTATAATMAPCSRMESDQEVQELP
jgi:hypothetical protein